MNESFENWRSKTNWYLHNNPALHRVPAVHIGAKENARHPRLEAEYLRPAGVGVERPHSNPGHVAAGAADDYGQARGQARDQVQDDDRVGSVGYHQQFLRH